MDTPKLTIAHKSLRLCVMLLIPILAGCWLHPFKATEVAGGMLLRHGAYLYRVGGKNNAGAISPTILMAKINLDNAGQALPLQWQQTAPLPEGRAYAAVFAAGNLLYVLGGEGDNGTITSTVYYTRINPDDGTLGFGDTKFWEKNSIALPEQLSHAAWELYDGRIFLVGGKTPQGAVDSIIHARLYQDGQIGQWYTSPQKLPSARYGAASTIHNDSLVVAGGADASGTVLNDLVSYPVGAYGLLETPQIASLPRALYAPILLADKDTLLIAGGYDDQFKGSEASYRYSGGSWTEEEFVLKAEGPSSGRGAGSLWYVQQARRMSLPVIMQVSGINLAPDRPIIVPGSGLVPASSPVRAKAEPGTTLYFHAGTETSESWEPLDTLSSLSSSVSYTFGSFSPSFPSAAASPPVKRSYRTRSTGFLVSVSGVLEPKEPGSGLDTINFRDNVYDETAMPLSSAWCRLAVTSHEELQLSFADADAPSGGTTYTGKARITLFEIDLYTEALDMNGLPVLGYTSDVEQPIRLDLQPGNYYLLIEDSDGLSGRTIGLAFYEQ
jgi:hypothetical protein